MLSFVARPMFRRSIVYAAVRAGEFCPRVVHGSPGVRREMETVRGVTGLNVGACIAARPLVRFSLSGVIRCVGQYGPLRMGVKQGAGEGMRLPRPATGRIGMLVARLRGFAGIRVGGGTEV